MVNCHSATGKGAKLSDFDPYAKNDAKEHATVLTKDNMHLLKKAWFGKA